MHTLTLILKPTALIALFIATLILFSSPVSAADSKATGFKWIYEYTASNNTGLLTITVYEDNKATVYTHPSICTVMSDHVACDVNIQDAANQAYANSGLTENAPVVGMYPEIYAEVRGEFNQLGIDATIVSHPSLEFNIATSKTKRAAQFTTDWSGLKASSKSFGYKANKAYQMTTAFEPGKFMHLVNTKANKTENASAAEIPFQLNGTTFRIYEPKGFNLYKFIVDPAKNGFG